MTKNEMRSLNKHLSRVNQRATLFHVGSEPIVKVVDLGTKKSALFYAVTGNRIYGDLLARDLFDLTAFVWAE